MSDTPNPPIPFPIILEKLRVAYADALGNGDSELTAWYMLIDEHAEAVFNRITELQNGMANAADVITGTEKEARRAREELVIEISRREALKRNHEAQVKALTEEPDRLRAEIAQLKSQIAQQKTEIAALTTKHDGETLHYQNEVKELKGLLARLFHFPLSNGSRVEHELTPHWNARIRLKLPPSDPAHRIPPFVSQLIADVMNLEMHRK